MGARKACEAMMKWGDMAFSLASGTHCTTHAYVRYSGVTSYCLRLILIERVEPNSPTSHSNSQLDTQ